MWYSHLFKNFPQFVKGFSIVNEAEVDIFLEFPCFLYEPTDIGSLISDSPAFSKPSLCIWKFLVHVLLKPSLKESEHNSASMWNEHHCMVVWTIFGIAFLWNWNENWPFPALWSLLSFPDVLTYWVQHFNSIILWIWNSSAGIPPPPLALFVVMLPTAHLTSHARMSGSRWVATNNRGYLGHLRPFLYSSSVCSCHLFLVSSASVKSLPYLSFIVPIPLHETSLHIYITR